MGLYRVLDGARSRNVRAKSVRREQREGAKRTPAVVAPMHSAAAHPLQPPLAARTVHLHSSAARLLGQYQ